MSNLIRLSKSVVGEQEINATRVVLERGFLGMGQEVQLFETELSSYLAGREVACVNTGTSALQLALQSVGVGIGDEVLVPTLTYVASFQAISATGAKPVACDVREIDGLLDLRDAERRVTSRTRALMLVHYASFAGDIDEVYAFARRFKLRIIEDAAHAFGCMSNGRRVGSFGDIVCFSFDGIKNITSGEGGAVVSADEDVMSRVRDSRLLGVVQDSERRFRGERSWELEVDGQGWRYHMSDIMAAIGRVQLTRFESEFKPKRKALLDHYRKALTGVEGIALFDNVADGVVPHIFSLRILDNRRDEVRLGLAEKGVQTGIHYKPNHLLNFFGGGMVTLPVAERLYSEILTLPLHPEVTFDEVNHVVQNLMEILRKS